MSDRLYLGRAVSSFASSPTFEPWSRVVIWYDDEKCFSAGDDTGRTMELDCPWATQQMANDLLASVKDVRYTPYEAAGALLDPAAELGDGVTINGVYGMLASIDADADAMFAPDISAPGEEEIDHEYPYLSPQQRELKRTVRLGENYYGTTIDRRNGVQVKTVDAAGNVLATATFNAGGISFVTPSGSGVSLGADGKFHGNLQMDGSISWADLDSNVQAEINDRGGGDENPGYIKRSYIDQTNIQSPNIFGGKLYATGQGADDQAAYYIYDGGVTLEVSADGATSNVVVDAKKLRGYISYDGHGAGTEAEAKNRVLFNTEDEIAMKLNAGGNMSLQAKEFIYVHTPLRLVNGVHYGTSLPSEGLSAGRLFFLLDE